jgi:hypothetical protein
VRLNFVPDSIRHYSNPSGLSEVETGGQESIQFSRPPQLLARAGKHHASACGTA